MKIEDAIKNTKELTNRLNVEDAIEIIKEFTNGLNENGYLRQANNLAIKALEKQIPKRPIIEPYNPALCPSCGRELSDFECDGCYTHWKGLKMCECGQVLDWRKLE